MRLSLQGKGWREVFRDGVAFYFPVGVEKSVYLFFHDYAVNLDWLWRERALYLLSSVKLIF